MRRKTIIVAVAISLIVCPSVRPQGATESPLVAEARRKQESVKSLRCVYVVKELHVAGSKTAQLQPMMDQVDSQADKMPSRKRYPEQDVTFELTSSALLSGDRVRYEDHLPVFDLPTKTYKPTVFLVSIGPQLRKTLLHETKKSPNEGTGIFDNVSNAHVSGNFVPMLANVRGVHPGFASFKFFLRDYTLTGAKKTIRTKACQEYHSRLSPDSQLRMWVDPDQSQSIMRVEYIRKSQLHEQIDIEYELHPVLKFWLPKSWTIREFGKSGNVLIKREVTIQELEINARDYSDDEIDVKFPAGLRVADNRDHKEYRVTENGSLALTDGRGNPTGGTIPMPGRSFWLRYRWLVLSLCAVVAIGIILFRSIRRWRNSMPEDRA